MSNLTSIQDYANTYRAMFKWAQENYADDRVGLAQYILESIAAGEPDCVFFDILALTGDKVYDGNTILKAADLILNTIPKERDAS